MLAAPIWYSKWRTPVVADHIMISWFGHHQEHQRSITIQTFHCCVRSGHSGVYQHPWLAQKTSETRPQSTRPHQSSLLINLERVMRQSHNTLKPCPMRGIIYKLDTFKRTANLCRSGCVPLKGHGQYALELWTSIWGATGLSQCCSLLKFNQTLQFSTKTGSSVEQETWFGILLQRHN